MPFDAKEAAGQVVQHPHSGRGQIVPGNGANKRAEKKRNEVERLELLAPRAIGTRVEPGQRNPQKRGQDRRAGADDQGVKKRLANQAVPKHLGIVVQAPFGVKSQIVEDQKTIHGERHQGQQHRRGNDQANQGRGNRFLIQQTAPATDHRARGSVDGKLS